MNITIGRDSGDLGDLSCSGNRLGVLGEKLDNALDSSLRPTTKVHRIAPRGDVLDTLSVDCPSEDSSCGCTITSNLVSLLCNILNKATYIFLDTKKENIRKHIPCTQILKLVLQSDGLGDSDTIYKHEGVNRAYIYQLMRQKTVLVKEKITPNSVLPSKR